MKKTFKTQILLAILVVGSFDQIRAGAVFRKAQEHVGSAEKNAVRGASEEISRLEANRLIFAYVNRLISEGGNLTDLDAQIFALPDLWSTYVQTGIKNQLNSRIDTQGFFAATSLLSPWLQRDFQRYRIPLQMQNDQNNLGQGYLASRLGYLYIKPRQTVQKKVVEYVLDQKLPAVFVSDLERGVYPWWFNMLVLYDSAKNAIKNNIKNLLREKIKKSGDGCLRLKVGRLPDWLSDFKNYTDIVVKDRMLADFVASTFIPRSEQKYWYVYTDSNSADSSAAIAGESFEAEREKIAEILQTCIKIEEIENEETENNEQQLPSNIEYVLVDIKNLSENTDKIQTIFTNNPNLTLVVYSEAAVIPNQFRVPVSVTKLSIVGRNITQVGDDFLDDYRNIVNLQLPSGLIRVGNEFLASCDALTSLQLPSGLTRVGNEFLAGCGALTSLQLPSGLTQVGDRFLAGCRGLASVQVPSGLTQVGNDFLVDCSSLTSVQLPSGLTQVGNEFLASCDALTSLQLPSGLTQVGDRFLFACRRLVSLQLPSGLTRVGDEFLFDCSSLVNLQLPSDLTEVGNDFLFGCSSLVTLQLPSGLTWVDHGFLFGCSSLVSLALPSGLTDVGNDFLFDCSSLVSLQLPSGLTRVGDHFLTGCSSLVSLNVPSGLTRVGDHFLAGCSSLTAIAIGRNFPQQTIDELKQRVPNIQITLKLGS
ncbi:MAG: leucine-rich repeat domain-containing protein [Candidatus Babeliales bacterium]|jgi:hypothetical protein